MRALTIVFAAMILVGIALPVCAESIQPDTDTFFDWGYLATYSGAIAAVVFIVEFLKLPIDRIGHVPTRAVVYVVSLFVLLCAQLFIGNTFTVETVALAMFNAVIVAFSAMGVYERVIALPETVKNSESIQLTNAGGVDIQPAQTIDETEIEKNDGTNDIS